jgi:ABC-type glycerol-3-phosphate transport system substrate-binding protein
MKRRMTVVVLAAAIAAACGGGSSSPTAATTTPSPVASGDPTKVAQLDASSFDAVVLGGSRPSLVEFHSPT